MFCLPNFIILNIKKSQYYNSLQPPRTNAFRLNGPWLLINDEVWNFHNWILCHCEPFRNIAKNQRKYQSTFLSLKFKLLWSLSHVNMLIIYEYFQHWIWLILFIDLVWILSLLLKTALQVILKNLFLNYRKCKLTFSLLTNYSNYFAFDEVLALLDPLTKSSRENEKRSNIPEASFT